MCGDYAIYANTQITFVSTVVTGGNVATNAVTSVTGAKTLIQGTDVAASTGFEASLVDTWGAAIEDRDGIVPTTSLSIAGDYTFLPGTYATSGSITVAANSVITFDAGGDENAQFLIQGGSTMLVLASATTILAGNAKAENIVWVVSTLFEFQANAEFHGNIMAGTAVTFGAGVKLHGSVLAKTAVTLGASNEVYGCILAVTAITFGTSNIVTVQQPPVEEVAEIPAISDLLSLVNINDEVIVGCLPLIETPTAACADTSEELQAEMLALLNTCTNDALATSNITRRTSGIDTPQVADTVIVPVASFNQPGGLSRRLRERRLTSMCYTTGHISLMLYIWCCSDPSNYSYCGSLTNNARRRELCEGCPAPDPLTSAQVQAILGDITDECTTAYRTFAASHPGCFAEIDGEGSLGCEAIMMTGGTA
jgi:hypothetical protein